MATIGQHYTRGNSRKLTVMRCRFDLWKYCFTNRIVNMWNTLPDNVILADNVNQFKNRLDKQVVQTALTATFNSYGNRQISTPPPQNRYPWTDQETTRHNWLRPRENPLHQIWYKSTRWGLLGKWVKYKKNYFFYLYFFSQVRVQVRPVDGFLRATAQKTWNHARMCLFGSEQCPPKFWG